MVEPFSSARIKQRRAQTHFDELRDAVKRFGNPEPYETARSFHDDGMGYTVVLRPLRSIAQEQEELAGIVGDIASNARAALDHAIYDLASFDTIEWDFKRRDGALHRAQFPIFSDPDEYAGRNGNGPGSISMLADPHRAFIKTLQPFAAEEAKPLADLHAINNQDKHRIVHVVGLLPTNFGTNFAPRNPPPGLTIDVSTLGVGVITEHDAPLLFVRFNKRIPQQDMTVDGREWKLSAQLCFDAGSDLVAGKIAGITCFDILQALDWSLNRIEGEYGALWTGHSGLPVGP